MNELKLGKLPAEIDKRTIRLSSILQKELPPVPISFDAEAALCAKYPGLRFPGRIWRNDQLGDCVIAGRANQTRIFEAFEQSGKLVTINDEDVVYEYYKESYGLDTGLVMLRSLNAWRNGWQIDRKGRCKYFSKGTPYSIYAFAAIDSIAELIQAIYYLRGGYIGFRVPQYALDQFSASKPWDINPAGDQTVKGGHCIQFPAYTDNGNVLSCWTWGKRQIMTRAFFEKWVDEAYAIVDNKNAFTVNSPVDVTALDTILKEIAAS